MIPATLVRRVFLVRNRISFRKGHDGLLGESYKLGLKPYEGDLVIFIGRHRSSIKILLNDGTGLWVLYKRFHEGSVRKQFKFLSEPTATSIRLEEISLLLSGATYTLHE